MFEGVGALMIGAFIVWTIVALMFAGIGAWAWFSKDTVGFFAGVKAPEVKDPEKYNHQVAMMWFGYALLYELLGIPFLFFKQNSAMFIVTILGVMALTIGLLVAYTYISASNQK